MNSEGIRCLPIQEKPNFQGKKKLNIKSKLHFDTRPIFLAPRVETVSLVDRLE